MLPALEALVQLNEELDDERDRAGEPVLELYEWGARNAGRYQAEPPGREDWDPAAVFMPRGWGDCEDLACKRAADLRRAGETSARADTYRSRIRPDGSAVWHAIVVRGDGTLEDPSALLGMPTHRGHAPTGTPWAEVMRAAMGQDAPSRLVLTVDELAAAYERLAPMAHRRLGVLELLDFDVDWRAVLSCVDRPEACSRATRARLSDRLEQWVARISGMPPAPATSPTSTRRPAPRGADGLSLRIATSGQSAPLVDCVRRGEAFARLGQDDGYLCVPLPSVHAAVVRTFGYDPNAVHSYAAIDNVLQSVARNLGCLRPFGRGRDVCLPDAMVAFLGLSGGPRMPVRSP